MKVPGVEALREALAALGLDTRGHKDKLKKRLRTATKALQPDGDDVVDDVTEDVVSQRKLPLLKPDGQDFHSYLVLDFEATCQRHEPAHGHFLGFPNEIIEFPVVLLQWRKRVLPGRGRKTSDMSWTSSDSAESSTSSSSSDGPSSVEGAAPVYSADVPSKADDNELELVGVDEYRSFVKPTWRPKLSQFCTELTGITQSQVDGAQDWANVVSDLYWTFLEKHHCFTPDNKTAWVTDGPWDLRDFVAKQVYISGTLRPLWLAGHYIDLRTSITQYFSHASARRKTDPVTGQPSPASPNRPESPSQLATPTISSTAADFGAAEAPSQLKVPIVRPLANANIPTVLEALGLEPFKGREHSGIDDVRNLARILQELVRPERRWRVSANAFIRGKERRFDWMDNKGGINWPHPPAP